MKIEQQHNIQDKSTSGSTKKKKSRKEQVVIASAAAAKNRNEKRESSSRDITEQQSRPSNYKNIKSLLHTNGFFLLV